MATLHTDMAAHTTTFASSTPKEDYSDVQIQTKNDVSSKAKAGADEPFSTSKIVGASNRHGGDNPAYGPEGAFIDVGDTARGREIHGGGSGLPDPFADRQGWKATMGCTRGQNEDVIKLGQAITDFQKANPGVTIPYVRDDPETNENK
jgi:hypothetical protein